MNQNYDETEDISLENIKMKNNYKNKSTNKNKGTSKNENKNIYNIILTVLIVSLILLIGIDKVTKPIPLSYGKAIESVEEVDDKVFIKFNPEVSNFQIDSFGTEYQVMAWKTNFSKLFKNSQSKNTTINKNSDGNISIYFIDQENEPDKLIYGSKSNDVPQSHSGQEHNGGRITLPRLAMNYYLFIMGLSFLFFWILSIIFRNRDRIKKISATIMIIPLSYIIAHICILGLQGSTHHIIRDLVFVLVATILICSIIIVIRNKKQYFRV